GGGHDRRTATRGEDLRPDRHAGVDDPRRGGRVHRTAGGQSGRIGQPKNDLRSRWHRSRKQAGQGRGARRPGAHGRAVPGAYNEGVVEFADIRPGSPMSKRFTILTVLLSSAVAFLVGLILAGGVTHAP